jgi:YD repeat-containing protein
MYKFSFLTVTLFLILSRTWAQVDLPTGKAEFNFPIYNYSDANRLAVSINLNYTGGGGIKVDELASSVGLGWELESGGMISRATIGEPDDQVGRNLDGYDAIASGYAKHSYPLQCIDRAGWVPLYPFPTQYVKLDDQTIADREQDIFTFRFGNEAGSFVIGSDGTILPLRSTKLKIEKVEEDMSASQVVTTISKFVITTETGIQYVFNDKTLNRIISYEGGIPLQFYQELPIANRSYFLSKTSYKLNNFYAVDNWYLSEIINPQTGKKITFNYQPYNLDYIVGEDAVQSVEKVSSTEYKEVVQWIQRRFSGQLRRISSIQLPNNTNVEFEYFVNDRIDLVGDKALKQIMIKENGVELSGYTFTYQYFSKNNIRDFNYSFPAAEVGNARLSLLSIQKKGADNYLDKPCTFSYYIGDKSGLSGYVPPRMAPSRDHWGYYTIASTYPYDNNLNIYKNMQNLFLPRNREVGVERSAENGTLKTVKYPTGGTLGFEYELNTAWVNNEVKNAGGVRVKKVTVSDAVDDTKQIINEYKYVDEDAHSSSWGYEAPVYDDKTYTLVVLPGGGDQYTASLVYNLGSNILSKSLNNVVKRAALQASAASAAGGAGGTSASSATFAAASIQMALITAIITYMGSKLFSSDPKAEEHTTDNLYSAHPRNLNPLPLLYRRVEVYNGSQTDNIGKTVYEFTSDKDFPLIAPVYEAPYSYRQRYFAWAYGLTRHYKVFNKQNDLVKEVYNKYNVNAGEYNMGTFHSVKCLPRKVVVSSPQDFSFYSRQIFFATDSYYPVTGKVELEYTVEKNYAGDNYIMQRTDYTYDPLYFNQKTAATVNSLGEKIETRVYYPYDYNINGALTQMKSKNMFTFPVSTETWLLKSGVEDRLLDAQVMDYQQITNGDYKPVKTYSLKTNVPISKATIGEFDPTQLNRNTSLLKLEQTVSYNGNGDVNQTVARGEIESNIYDDNSEGIIAKVINANTANIAYSSFEENAMGNWQIPVAGVSLITADATAPTGKQCLKLSAASTLTKSGLDGTKEYWVSYWYKGGAVTLSGAVVSKEITGETINGWTFKMLRIKQVSSLSVSGTAFVDELRLYPLDAKMYSKCYNELMKVSDETDPENVTQYYEYDELGRLKVTRDARRNIVRLHEYKSWK